MISVPISRTYSVPVFLVPYLFCIGSVPVLSVPKKESEEK
jgi:hypothetical protein